jgi:outer membrane lipoprotein-sorting protein
VVAVTAAIVGLPQLASGQSNPVLPARTAAQLLAAIEHVTVPNFSGTVVQTARLGLPNLSDAGLPGVGAPGGGLVGQVTDLLAGSHTVQIAYAGPDRQRIAVFLDDLTETDVVHNGPDVWTYSSADNSVSHTVHQPAADGSGKDAVRDPSPTPTAPPTAIAVDPRQAARQALAEIDPSTAVTVDRTAHVAGRSAYQLVLAPRNADSLIGSVRIAIDATTSLPLRVQVWPRATAATPAIEVAFTSIRFATPAASTFSFTTPPGAVMKSGPFAVNPRTLETPRGVGARKAGQVRIAGPVAGAPPPATTTAGADHSGFQVTGTNWLHVLVADAPAMNVAPQAGPSPMQQLTATLDQLATPVTGGRLLRTTLLSVLVTDDGRILIGAVTPSYLEQLAAQGLGK